MRHTLTLPIIAALAALMSGAAARAQHAGPEAEIRDLRLRYNDVIQRRDVDGFADLLSPTFTELLSSGSLTTGANAVAESYAAIEFRDPAFIAYDRRTDSVEVSSDGRRAVERGRWAARSREQGDDVLRACGANQAGWVRTDDRWRVQTEAYVDLGCDAPVVP